MNSLLSCDYQELLAQQPVSRSAMATLQHGALTDEPVCQEYFRKNMISLGAYLALQRIDKNHLDRNLVLENINADHLEELGFRKSFSEWGNEQIHIEIVSEYIDQVINDLYVKTHDGVYIERNTYQHVSALRAQWRVEHGEDPTAPELSQAAGVSYDIAETVGKNERWKKERDELREKEAKRFQRLKEIIRDKEDMSFWDKLDFLETLTRMPKKMRPFFYALYGVDDGIPKPIEQIAGQFMMKPDQAKQDYQEMLEIHHCHYVSCVTQDPYYDLMVELKDFLIENEKNKKVYQAYCERIARKREQHRRKLKDYLD